MIELWAREGASFKTEEKAEEASGEADAQTDILVINVNQHTIDNELSNHCDFFLCRSAPDGPSAHTIEFRKREK